MKIFWYIVYTLLHVYFFCREIVCVTDGLARGEVLRDGETIISAGGSFELGFFSMSSKRYLGIWYKNIPKHTVVWVANREVPLMDESGFLEIIPSGVLTLRNGTNGPVWSSSSSVAVGNPFLKLLDSGNLVVKVAEDDNGGNFLWQSFDHPTDTFLPGMKLGQNFVTGLEVFISSWKSSEDPAPGEYTYHCDPTGYPQNFIKSGTNRLYRNGQWNGLGFSGNPGLTANPIFSYEVVFNSKEAYYTNKLLGSTLTRLTLSPSGVAQRWTWENQSTRWILYLSAPNDNCGTYGLCGSYGGCDVGNSAICGCLEKFEPKNREKWGNGDFSSGCIRKTPLDCASGDGFQKYSNFKLPDTHNSTFNRTLSLEECKQVCLKNCSCTAYSNLDIRDGGSGCLLWFGDLGDMKYVSGAGQEIYIRLAFSELVSSNEPLRKKVKLAIMVLLLSLCAVLLSFSVLLYIHRRKKRHLRRKQEVPRRVFRKDCMNSLHDQEIELPLFELSALVQATNNFSADNKLGEGGYGPVYLAKLEEGLEFAVKRLSKSSSQGIDEFKNEAIFIAKLQHRNLVKLLGCCIERGEKILIYEYMPNKSLDYFIFDQKRWKSLDWPKRFHIIQGIARGLLYLHQDSRLRIIHRDLKASNVLLDVDLNPKISDFGTARTCGGSETGDNTSRIVGTHGYMSPEYAGAGVFSVKSDVFSFGVLVLEIVSGRRNKPYHHEGNYYSLLGHVWRLIKEGRALELVDSSIADSCRASDAFRAIQVGLLCVQQRPEDRPDMFNVINMLGNERLLPEATQPGFYLENYQDNAEMTITAVEAR